MECVQMFNVDVDLTPPVVIQPAPHIDQVRALQAALLELPQIESETEHHFADGLYIRKFRAKAAPEGMANVIVGQHHKHAHPVMLTKGEVTINTDKGMERIRAPHYWVSQPGAKRALVVHEDCEFVTVHITDETDVAQIEAELLIPDPMLQCQKKMLPDFTDELQGVYA